MFVKTALAILAALAVSAPAAAAAQPLEPDSPPASDAPPPPSSGRQYVPVADGVTEHRVRLERAEASYTADGELPRSVASRSARSSRVASSSPRLSSRGPA